MFKNLSFVLLTSSQIVFAYNVTEPYKVKISNFNIDPTCYIPSIPKDPLTINLPSPEPSEYLERHYPNDENRIDGYDESRGEGVPRRIIYSLQKEEDSK